MTALAVIVVATSNSAHAAAARRGAAPSFRNHVQAILTRHGCNSGACHGAAAGKGGLKLTLRGYDSEADYIALTRQARGRRVVSGEPNRSLLLLKPAMLVGHGGGERIKSGSADFKVLSAWIAAGATGPKADDPQVVGLEVLPAKATLRKGQTQPIRVRARFSNGQAEDVTRWVKFGTSESAVATVDDNGLAKVQGPGEAAITVWYASRVAFARIVSPFDSGAGAPPTGGGLIDRHINAKLASLNLPASPRCTDGEFLRRASIDTCGILPTAEETRRFLADTRPDKRERLVTGLLDRAEYVDYWAYKWSDLFLVSTRKLAGNAMTAFYNWLRKSVDQNKPWDRLATEMLTATGSTLDNGAANYYALHKSPVELTETTTQAFLGMSVQCARCHNHPMERWTQRDYYQMANLFSRIRLKTGDRAGEILVLNSSTGEINHPRMGVPLPPRPLDGKPLSLQSGADRREHLAAWLVSPENPYFSRALVNRVWRNFMGRGLVEREDDLRLTNPPSNHELFDALAADFSANGYDVKRLIRLILLSDAYQRSSKPVGANAKDDRFYSRYLPRRLSAEVLLDAMSHVTGVPTEFPGAAKGTRALQLRDSVVTHAFLASFGRPERVQTCSCERQEDATVSQALHLANGETLNQKLSAPRGTIAQLAQDATNDEVVEELFLSALQRVPTDAERAKLIAELAAAPEDDLAPESDWLPARRAAIEDLYWAVLTSEEFLFGH